MLLVKERPLEPSQVTVTVAISMLFGSLGFGVMVIWREAFFSPIPSGSLFRSRIWVHTGLLLHVASIVSIRLELLWFQFELAPDHCSQVRVRKNSTLARAISSARENCRIWSRMRMDWP
jgi:hypothetical protein